MKNNGYRWPQKGDRLLHDSGGWELHSLEFSQNAMTRNVHIWTGYMNAGAVLIKACEESPSQRHFLIYPVLYNYRHGIELAMKWIIDRYGHYSNIKFAEKKNHDLIRLWRSCKVIIADGSDDCTLKVVEQVIKDFHDLDKYALAFRYSTKKNGVPFALPDIPINPNNIRDVMDGINNFFDGADAQLDDYSVADDW